MRFEMRDQAVAEEPGQFYAALRGCPVAHVDDYDGFWILSRYDDVVEAARNTPTFSSADGITIPRLPIPPQICLEQDDPEHAKFRKPLQQWLSPARMAAMEEGVRQVVTTLIDEFAGAGEADLAAALAGPIPPIVMAMLLGLPDSDWPTFRDQMDRTVTLSAAGDLAGAGIAAFEIVAYLNGMLADRREHPRDDMITHIATLEVEGEKLTDQQAVSMAFLLLGAGHETTVGALGGLFYYLAREPEWQDRCRQDPKLLVGATEEALRLVAPLPGMGRTLLEEVKVGGTAIPEGGRVMLMYGSANRDPEVFTDPEAFRPDRGKNPHIAFGSGVHRCVGAPLARLELKVAAEEVLRRLPTFTLAGDDAVEARYGTSRGYRRVAVRWDQGSR